MLKTILLRSTCLMLLGNLAATCFAQQGSIETDRPDQASTPGIVPQGWLQLESGFVRTVPEPGTAVAWTLPDVLLKMGLTPWLELRTGGGGQFRDATRLRDLALRPLVIGAKARVCTESGARPRVALLSETGVPGTGAEPAKYAFGSLLLLADHGLSDRASVTLNAGVQWDGADPAGVPVYTLSTGLGLTHRLKGFVELYGKMPLQYQADHRWDAGFTMQMSDDLQLDASSGRGFGDPEWFLNLGVSIRFNAWGVRP